MADTEFCQQRSIQQLNNVPLPRFNLDSTNPYLTQKYTKSQLDMRRKVEILKYSANKSSTQTNSLTKREKFALLIRGGFRTPSSLNIGKRGNSNCVEDATVPTPTSSCDVPGPVVYLQEDATVPLYNYSGFNIRTYPNYVPDNINPWQFVANSDIAIDNGTTSSNPSYYLIINNLIDYPQYSYNITTPIGITFSGSVPVAQTQPAYLSETVHIKITTATLDVYYNNNLAKAIKLIDLSVLPIIGSTLPDVSFNVAPNYVGTFASTQFFGTLAFNGVVLYTAPTYVYSFKLNLTARVTTDNLITDDYYANNFRDYTNLNFTIISNPTASENLAQGCNVSVLTSTYNPGAILSGVPV
jgi:hypothetical protein